MISSRALSKRYARGRAPAVDDVTVDVAEGEAVALLGPNGAGKTTLVAMLAGALPPTSGDATVAGFSVTRKPLRVRRSVGLAPQGGGLYPELTVEENVRFFAKLAGVRGARDAARDAVDRVDMRHLAARRAGALSGGERQRASLATALVHEPPVLFLDEPTVALDPAQRDRVHDVVRAAVADRAVTLVVVTHDLDEARALADRVLFMRGGRVVDEAPATEAARFRALYRDAGEAGAGRSAGDSGEASA